MHLFHLLRRIRLGLRLLKALENIDNDPVEALTTEDKKLLAIFSTTPTYKSLVKFWRSGVSFIQKEIFNGNPTLEDIRAANWMIKLENLKRNLLTNYRNSYAKPKSTQASTSESVIEDLEVLAAIGKSAHPGQDGDATI